MDYRLDFPDPLLLQTISNAKRAIDSNGGMEYILRKSEKLRRATQLLKYNNVPSSLIKEYIRILNIIKPSLNFLSSLSKLRIKKDQENMFSQYISNIVSDNDAAVIMPRAQYSDDESPRGPPINSKKKPDLSFALFLFSLFMKTLICLCVSYYLGNRAYILTIFIISFNIVQYLKTKK